MTYNGETPVVDGSYTVVQFLTTGEFVTPAGVTEAEVLVVAGGGGGSGAGGGAGGVLQLTGVTLTGTMPGVVGAGGTGRNVGTSNGDDGEDSTFASETAAGGGGGGWDGHAGSAGGSGGGGGNSGATDSPGGAATPSGQGNAGGATGSVSSPYPAGGGGGAGGAGDAGASSMGGAGGAGVTWHGLDVGGGGGGSVAVEGTGGPATHGGGAGMGGAGDGNAGAANTGGGGGGAQWGSGSTTPGAGGSGIIVVRYLTPAGGDHDMVGMSVIALVGFADLNAATMKATGVVSLGGSANLTSIVGLAATSVISLTGYAYLSGIPHGYDTMQGLGVVRLNGSARLSSDFDPPLPPTDDLGWTEEDVGLSAIDLVKILGLPIPRGNITVFDIELDDQGGPQSAQVTVDSDLVRAPKMLSIMRVTYQPPGLDAPQRLFYGRLDSIQSNVDSGTGYTLTYGPALEKLRDHKAHRQVYITSDLSEWQIDQGPRTAPDVFAS